MNKIYFLFICIACLLASGCSNERQVNGRSVKRAFKSARVMKEYLPKDQKLEFQVAFWTLRNGFENDEEFLDSVHTKTANEIIVVGKEKFEEMRNSGYGDYQKFTSWDDMIAKDKQEREQQDMGVATDRQKMQRDRTNNVLYDLR